MYKFLEGGDLLEKSRIYYSLFFCFFLLFLNGSEVKADKIFEQESESSSVLQEGISLEALRENEELESQNDYAEYANFEELSNKDFSIQKNDNGNSTKIDSDDDSENTVYKETHENNFNETRVDESTKSETLPKNDEGEQKETSIQQQSVKTQSIQRQNNQVKQESIENDQLIKNLEKLGFPINSDLNAAVKKFQEYYNVKENEPGVVGTATLAKIDEILSTPLQRGKHSQKTVQLKKDLARLGFPVPGTGTDYYGPSTESQVKEFQKYYGLVVNGIADEVTLKKIEDLLTGPMFNGLKRDDVVQLKKNLEKIGFKVSNNPNDFYGPTTESKVKEFQAYYGVTGDQPGVAGPATLAKIDEILSTPLQRGKHSQKTVQLKKDLARLGFPVPGTGTDYYGPSTEEKVKEFQRHYNLVVNGIADEITLRKINELIENLSGHIEEIYLDITLEQALDMQMKVSPQTDKYRNEPAYVLASDIAVYFGGTISGNRVNVRTQPKLDSKYVYKTLDYGTAFIILDENITGDFYDGSTKWYKIKYDGKELYVHSKLATKGTQVGIPKGTINVYSKKNSSSHVYAKVNSNDTLNIVKKDGNWYEIRLGTWRNATAEDVRYYLDPKNFIDDEFQRFQFVDLAKPSGVSVKVLNDFLANKGVFKEMGEYFIKAGHENGINELYLISHAMLETGNGTSQLARGVKYNGVTVYNVYGIGAYDHDPINLGAKRAYEEGWTTLEKAIIGGAQFIGNNYIKAGQSTLYEMRWNPMSMNNYKKASHQYATDIGWASKQVYNLKKLYDEIGIQKLNLKIPVYKTQ